MNTKKSILNIVSFLMKIVVSVVILILGAYIWYLLGVNKIHKNENSRMLQTQKSLEMKTVNLIKEKKELAQELEIVKQERIALTSKVEELASEATEYKQKLDEKEKQDSQLGSQVLDLRQQVLDKNKELETLKELVDKYKEQNAALSKRVEHFLKNPQSVSAGAVELSPVIVRSAYIKSKDNAKVLEVNKEFEFVVIDIGTDHGVKKGSAFFVSRGKKLLGRIIVEQADNEFSVAKPIYKSLTETIKAGDRVRY